MSTVSAVTLCEVVIRFRWLSKIAGLRGIHQDWSNCEFAISQQLSMIRAEFEWWRKSAAAAAKAKAILASNYHLCSATQKPKTQRHLKSFSKRVESLMCTWTLGGTSLQSSPPSAAQPISCCCWWLLSCSRPQLSLLGHMIGSQDYFLIYTANAKWCCYEFHLVSLSLLNATAYQCRSAADGTAGSPTNQDNFWFS